MGDANQNKKLYAYAGKQRKVSHAKLIQQDPSKQEMEAAEREFKADGDDPSLLLRSHRFMEYNEEEMDENPSNAEDDKQKDNFESEGESNGSNRDQGRARSMIFKPFRPGTEHDALR